jgi:hypothetical protein
MYMHYLSSAQGFWRKAIPHNLVNSCCLLGVHVERIIEPYARCLSLLRHPLVRIEPGNKQRHPRYL